MKLLVSIMFLFLAACSQEANKPKLVFKGGEDSGGGDIHAVGDSGATQELLKTSIRKFMKDDNAVLLTRYLFSNRVESKGPFNSKEQEIFINISFQDTWADPSYPMYDAAILKKIPGLFRSDADRFIAEKIKFSRGDCNDKDHNSKLASVDQFNANGRICLDVDRFAEIPLISLDVIVGSILYHELCHLKGYVSECDKVQTIAEEVLSANPSTRYMLIVVNGIAHVDMNINKMKMIMETPAITPEQKSIRVLQMQLLFQSLDATLGMFYAMMLQHGDAFKDDQLAEKTAQDEVDKYLVERMLTPVDAFMKANDYSEASVVKFITDHEAPFKNFWPDNFNRLRVLESL